jgi:hypothetical protein
MRSSHDLFFNVLSRSGSGEGANNIGDPHAARFLIVLSAAEAIEEAEAASDLCGTEAFRPS